MHKILLGTVAATLIAVPAFAGDITITVGEDQETIHLFETSPGNVYKIMGDEVQYIYNVEADYQNAKTDLASEKANVQYVVDELRAEQAKNADLSEENTELRNEVADQKIALDNKDAEINKLAATVADQEVTIADHEGEIIRMESLLDDADSSHLVLATKIATLEGVIAVLQDQVSILETTNQVLRTANDAAQAEVQNWLANADAAAQAAADWEAVARESVDGDTLAGRHNAQLAISQGVVDSYSSISTYNEWNQD